MENEKKNTALEENCSQEQNRKLLCYDEAISGATIECAFLFPNGNGAVKTETILLLWKKVYKNNMCL